MTKYPMLAVTSVLLLGLAGCANYSARPLDRLVTAGVSPFTKEKYISLTYRVFNTDDCFRYLDRNVIAAGYQPIHISVVNSTNKQLNFVLSSFSLPTVSSDEASRNLKTSTAGRAAGYGAAALFVMPILAVPAIVDGVKSSKANKAMNADFSRKTLRNQIISPYSMIDGLLFVPVESFNENFTLTLTDAATYEQFILSPANARITFEQE